MVMKLDYSTLLHRGNISSVLQFLSWTWSIGTTIHCLACLGNEWGMPTIQSPWPRTPARSYARTSARFPRHIAISPCHIIFPCHLCEICLFKLQRHTSGCTPMQDTFHVPLHDFLLSRRTIYTSHSPFIYFHQPFHSIWHTCTSEAAERCLCHLEDCASLKYPREAKKLTNLPLPNKTCGAKVHCVFSFISDSKMLSFMGWIAPREF